MSSAKLPNVRPIHDGSFVTVPSESWKELCSTINTIVDVLNTHSEKLSNQDIQIKDCTDNISKIATIMEDIYENLE